MLWRVAWVKAMQRREFIAGVGTVAAWPLAAHAQQTKSPRRIAAFFSSRGDDPEVTRQVARFQDELAKLGWLEGQTIHVDYRFADGNIDALAKELVRLQPELIVTQSTVLTVAIQQETHTIPIVFLRVSDPVGAGFVASLARPGGNLTGLLQYEPGIVSKWLAMLKEIAPRLASVAFISNPADSGYSYFLESAKAAAQPLVLEVVPNQVANAADIESSIAAFARVPDGGLLIVPSLVNNANRALIIGLASRYQLPAVYPWRYFVSEGGLMSYGVDDVDMLQDTASYVDRILRGAKPADLPVQAATKYETVVNLKTAKALGFDVPASLLVRADQVIE
jgi:putative ABC transport system substrate-binding protein